MRFEPTSSTSIVTRLTIGPPGTPADLGKKAPKKISIFKTTSVDGNMRMDWYVNLHSNGFYIYAKNDTIDEHAHPAATQQKGAVWWGDK